MGAAALLEADGLRLSYTASIEATPAKPLPREAREWGLAISAYKSDPPVMDKSCYYLDSMPASWRHGIYTALGTRDLQKRSYLAIKASWTEFKYINHESGYPNMAQLAFTDMVLTGEHLTSAGDINTTLNYYNVLNFDEMRADFLGAKFGIPQMFLPEIARSVEGNKEKVSRIYSPEGIPASEHVMGMAWVHDLEVYRAYMNWGPIDQSNHAKVAFGWDRDIEFTGDGENDDIIEISSDQSPVEVSVFKRPGKVVFVIMNNSDSDAKITIKPEWSKLGVNIPANLVDAYKEQALPAPDLANVLVPVEGESATFTVKARNFKALAAR